MFKELDERQTLQQIIHRDPEVRGLVEFVINSCCYCAWVNLI